MIGRSGRAVVAGLAAAALTGLGVIAGVATQSAAAGGRAASEATLTWSLNDTASAGAYYGGCNFLSAGVAGDHHGATPWTSATDPSPGYASQVGNVTIEKPNTTGNYVQPTWATKCTGPDGTTPLSTVTSSKSRVVFSHGSGVVDQAAHTATLHWIGSVTSVFYGGMIYWSATDPTLTVAADGTATLAASLSGYGSSMSDTSIWTTIASTSVTLATFKGVSVTEAGVVATPEYREVAITVGAGDTAQSHIGADWGSFPQSFIYFQHRTGESSYWYSSGLNDSDKVAQPVYVAYTLAPVDDPSSPVPSTTAPTSSASTAPSSASTAPSSASTTPSSAPTTPSTSGSTTTASTAPAYRPTVHLDTTSVTSGGTITYAASGFAPGERVDPVIHSDPVNLPPVTADSAGAVSGSAVVPATVPAGTHTLILTGATSQATAQSTLVVTAQASCALTDGVKGGSLTWGFKKSFRSYVGGPATNSITATGGAKILDEDLAVAGKPATGTFRWPFVSSSAYTSPGSFSVQYGGKVEFKYPSHFFDIWVANPKIVVSGTTGTLYADVSLTVTAPGQPPNTSAHTGEQLATIDLTGTTPVSDATGITRLLHTAIADVDSFSFEGNAFYTKGQTLDDATVLLSGCATAASASPDPPASTASSVANGLANDADLIPTAQFRPAGLANTGADLRPAIALAALLLASGAALVTAGRRRRSSFHLLRKGVHT